MACKTCTTRIRCFLGLKNCPPPSVPSVGSVELSSTVGSGLRIYGGAPGGGKSIDLRDVVKAQASMDERYRQRKLARTAAYKAPRSAPPRPTYHHLQERVVETTTTHDDGLTNAIMLGMILNDSQNTDNIIPSNYGQQYEAPAPAPVYECAPSPSYSYEAPAPSPSYDYSSSDSSSSCSSSDSWTSSD